MPRHGPSGEDIEKNIYEPCFKVGDCRADERDEVERWHVKVESRVKHTQPRLTDQPRIWDQVPRRGELGNAQ